MADSVVILAANRTPIGAFQGVLSGIAAPQLGAAAMRASLDSAGLTPDRLPPVAACEVLMGCVLSAGLGQAPSRQAAHAAGLPRAVGATTINKVCGSGMKAAMLGHDLIRVGGTKLVVAGGMESMSNAPYLLTRGRTGYRAGHDRIFDHIYLDGLEDAYESGCLMGVFADRMAAQCGFSRADQDDFAIESLRRAKAAPEFAGFKDRIAAVVPEGSAPDDPVWRDEQPARLRPERIATLKPVFGPDGTITAATASGLADGAAAVVLSSADEAKRLGVTPLARIVAHASHAQDPSAFTTAPIGAVRRLLADIDWRVDDVDLYEVNEAFAMVPMAFMAELGVRHDRLNIHGGACALGHPIGASGARILVDLIHDLAETGGRRGVASLCIGGGEATAIAVEQL